MGGVYDLLVEEGAGVLPWTGSEGPSGESICRTNGSRAASRPPFDVGTRRLALAVSGHMVVLTAPSRSGVVEAVADGPTAAADAGREFVLAEAVAPGGLDKAGGRMDRGWAFFQARGGSASKQRAARPKGQERSFRSSYSE